MMATFKQNANWDREFHSPDGMVGRYLVKKALATERFAKHVVGVDTGRLRASIKADKFASPSPPNNLAISVTASTRYAFLYHEGYKASSYDPKTKKYMKFPVKGGRIVFTEHVNHPAFKGNPYLRDAMVVSLRGEIIARAHG